MTITIYLPLLITPLFALTAGPLARRLPPVVATWLLTVAGLGFAAATLGALGLLSLPLVAQLPGLAQLGGWSDAMLASHNPVETPVAVVALALLLASITGVARVAVRRARALRAAYRVSALLPAHGELAVVESERAEAYALPGRPGRVVVSPVTLRALDGSQRRALLAHERAHLAQSHHLHLAAVSLAAASNPFLRRLPAIARQSCERWADETAAGVAGRPIVAAALARTQTLFGPAPALPAMAMSGSDLDQRLAALDRPAPRIVLWRLAVPVLLLTLAAVAFLNAAAEMHSVFELAQTK